MKRLSKIFVTIGLTSSMLFVSPSACHADTASEMALLAQQVAQFIQDLSLDNKKWSDIKLRLQQVDNIAKTITQGKQGYTSAHNIIKSSKQIATTAQELEYYIEYLEEFGDNFRIERAHTIYKSFCRKSDNIYNDVSKTLKSFDSLTDLKPLELIKAVDEATTELAEDISDMSETSISEVVQLCQEVAVDQVVEENQKFKKLNIKS